MLKQALKIAAVIGVTGIITYAFIGVPFRKKRSTQNQFGDAKRPGESEVTDIEKRVSALFEHIESAGRQYEFNSEFNNGTGYFDPLVRNQPLPDLIEIKAAAQNQWPVQFGWMESDSGRKIYVIDSAQSGRIVLFRRYIGLHTPVVMQTSKDIPTTNDPEGTNLFNTRRDGFEEVLSMLENMLCVKIG